MIINLVKKFSPPKKQSPKIRQAVKRIARSMVEEAAKIKKGEKVLIWFDPLGLQLVKELYLLCQKKTNKISFFMRDLEKDAQMAKKLPKKVLEHYFDEEKALVEGVDVILIVRGPKNPEIMGTVSSDRRNLYSKFYSQAHKKRIDLSVNWSLIYWPTQYEAKKEKMTYEQYFELFIKACDQPWKEIKKAQEKLVKILNKSKEIELIVNEKDTDPKKRTKVKLSTRGMTWVNSTIDLNFPGAEVYTAPILTSVNGQIFAPGEYLQDGKIIKDIYLKIKNGKIIEAQAEKNNEALQSILSRGEGARYFGEVALGTNPGLTRRFFNALLNEKVGGSFHMAIGHCYTFTNYGGKPVRVNNGNTEEKTPIHWDLTLLMHPSFGGGKVLVDGKIISENGKFLDPKLSILNPKN